MDHQRIETISWGHMVVGGALTKTPAVAFIDVDARRCEADTAREVVDIVG